MYTRNQYEEYHRHKERRRLDVKYRISQMVARAKQRAKKAGVPFDITPADVVWPDICPVFGIPLNLEVRGGGGADDSPTLDRIENEKGYVKGNVRIISFKANRLKRNLSFDELKKLLDNFRKVR